VDSSVPIVTIIQLMLAPGLMISACGLLLLSMNNKYSLVVNRIRLLNEERRRLFHKAGEKEINYVDNVRLESITNQLEHLVMRVRLVKNAVFSYTLAVASFVATSLMIGINFFSGYQNLSFVIIAFFLIGMILVLVGVGYAAYETIKGYSIIKYEVKAEE
jgi:Protein of unknown function (DUF2721)